MSEHPVLIPTSQGPAGGIVCEPAGPPRAALMLLQSGGRSGRSGFSSEWAILSRRLAALGTTVLRYDFWHEGDSSMIDSERYVAGTDLSSNVARDLALLRDVAAWFRERTRDLPLIVFGSCYGARLGIELAAELPAVATLLVVPYLRRVNEDDKSRWRERMLTVRRGDSVGEVDGEAPSDLDRLDPSMVEAFESALQHGPSWVLIGERDATEAIALERALADPALEVEVEPGTALYPGNEPEIQELVRERIVARVSRVLDSVA